MGIAELIAADLASTAFDAAEAACPAEPASYTPAGGPPASVAAIFLDHGDDRREADDGQANVQHLICLVRTAELAAPAAGDRVTRGGADWTVTGARRLTAALWRLELTRSDLTEKSRRDYRLRR